MRGKWSTHRLSWILFYGEIPDGMWVLHRCDNRKCVNPNHLYLGTHNDNMDDKVKRHRCRAKSQPGEINGRSKLTDSDVLLIRSFASCGMSHGKIAAISKINKAQVGKIIRGQSWKHLL